MPNPILTFAFIVATLLGFAFHLLAGGGAQRLALFLVMSWLGFAMGQAAGVSLGIEFLNIGEIRLLSALIGALFCLMMAHIFTSGRTRRQKG